jgi:UDP-glucose 4-epimerase
LGLRDVFCEPTKVSEVVYCPEKPSTPQNLLDSTKARTVLGWIPSYSWLDACKDMKNEMVEEPLAILWGKSSDFTV